jgi:hypothetical protein
MATKTKRELGKVPAGERDLVSGKKAKGGRTEIKEHLAAVRAANEATHVERMESCTAAAEGIVLTDAGPVDTDKAAGRAKRKPAKKLALTSRAKMGAARRAKAPAKPAPAKSNPVADAKAAFEASLAAVEAAKSEVTDAVLGIDWGKLPEGVTVEAAETYGRSMVDTWVTTADQRTVATSVGLTDAHRDLIWKRMRAGGFTYERRVNPDRETGRRDTTYQWRMFRPEPVAS